MGSSGKKGSGRAAAVAVQQQWKVGDLVLAKMRGFPAWPAVISDPEKWGVSAMSKKLFVYFYGTKQIAFCNYTDIEAFTEEKKKSLLLKRQGKGADFVRALDEIIDIYVTTKKQKMLESNSGDDEVEQSAEVLIRVRSTGNSSSLNNEGIELETHIPSNHKLDAAESMVETSGRVDSEEVFTASTADELQKNLVIDEPIESILDQIRQDPLATSTSSRKKRLRDDPQNGIVLQKGLSSLRTSRSLIANSSKFQESVSVYNSDPSGTLVPEVLKNENAESKSKQRLSHTFLSHDVNAPCTASSNGGSENVGAQVSAKAYVEVIELNRSVIEPRCHLVAPRNVYFDIDDKLNGNHKSCMNGVVIKKKKETDREHKDVANKSSVVSEEDDLPVVLNRTPSSSPKEARVIIYKGDGDEHLPLVKRARVRMCKPNLEETIVPSTHCEPVREEDKSETSSIMNNCDRHHASFSAEKSSPFSGSLLKINEDLNSSLVNDCSSPSVKDPILWKVKKYQLNDSVLDAEAALPPSKRLHRALEAMSANESESRDDRPESQRDTNADASIGLSETSIPLDCSSDAKLGSPVRLQRIHSDDCNSHANSQPRSPLTNLGKFSFVSPEVKPCNFHTEIVRGPHIRDCKKIAMNVTDEFSVPVPMVISKKERSQSSSSMFIEEEVTVSSSKGKPDKACSFLEKENNDTTGGREGGHYICSENVTDETVETTIQKEDALTNTEESPDCFPAEGTLTTVSASDMISRASSASRATVSSSVQSDEDSKIVNMRGASQETPSCRCISPDLTPMKQLIAAAQARRLMSRSASFPFSSLDSKADPDATVSPSLLHKGDSSGHGSPQNDLVNHTTIDDRVHVLQNGARSPHVGLRLKSVYRSCKAEANAAWKTFEALVYTLSRTKESIGRATRLAIDCAKYGMAGEVVEFLLHYLEREQSLHKKVDLLFLVDSITQCSRNQKGGDGGVYPSHVQSVLPRLLSAAAPCGNAASENRRQCLKVLRLWLERKTLPESIIRHHMQELDSANELYFSTGFSRRPMKTERAINDPLREMEGMLVDEYGSNTNFQLPHLLHANVLEDEEGNASDEKDFEAVTPERCAEMDREKGTFQTQKNRHVLEDVDVELEMEDVSPPCEVKMNLSPEPGANAAHLHDQVEQLHSLPFAPLPEDRPPSPPPLPSSPPPFVIPSSFAACAVVPQWQSGAHNLADAADLGPSSNGPSVQNKQSHSFRRQPSDQNDSFMPSKPATYYSPNYECVPIQMPPPPPVSYSTGCASNPSMHTQNNLQPLVSTSLSDTAYHVLPPPPTVSNHFSYVQSEPQQRAPSWRTHRFQYAHESDRGNFHCDQDTRRLVQHEQFQHQHEMRASSRFQPGRPHYDKIEASPATQPHHDRQLELPPVPCNGWSLPHRMSNYSTPASRPSVEGSTPNLAGRCGYWRPI